MKIKLNKTQKIFAAFALATLVAFLIWGCRFPTPSKEVKTDSTTKIVDTASLDTLK